MKTLSLLLALALLNGCQVYSLKKELNSYVGQPVENFINNPNWGPADSVQKSGKSGWCAYAWVRSSGSDDLLLVLFTDPDNTIRRWRYLHRSKLSEYAYPWDRL